MTGSAGPTDAGDGAGGGPEHGDVAGLSAGPVRAAELASDVGPDTGALVTFEGRVRATNDGRRVARLHYDAYPELAEPVFADILRRAREKHPVTHIRVLHRTGTLEVGETAVVVVVAAGHRAEAFAAARFVLEAVKAELPVWKREEYVDGTSRWLGEPAPADADGGQGTGRTT